ncbi:MAG: DUF262 domain-containing protein [Nanopusillaceae archaeon]
MKAETKPFVFLKEVDKLIVPPYQRNYVWTRENWEELLKGFSDKNRNYDFLGSIILKESPSEGLKQFEIVDGQQRLTTLSILLKALLESLPEELKGTYEIEINNLLTCFPDLEKLDLCKSSHNYRLQLRKGDAEAYWKILNGTVDIMKIDKNSPKILKCYKYYIKELKEYNLNEKEQLLKRLLNPNNRIFVVIILDKEENELKIFDTLNTTGIRLTLSDIVKNILYKQVIYLRKRDGYSEEDSKKYAIKLYEETWLEKFEKDQTTRKYWKSNIPYDTKKRNNLEFLLYSIAIIKNMLKSNYNILNLHKYYKKHIEEFSSLEDLEKFINDILEYADIYREKIDILNDDTPISFNDYKKRLLYILKELKIGSFHSFILYVFKKFKNDEDEIKEILTKLEKFIIKKQIISARNADYSNYSKNFIENISILDKEIDTIEWEKIQNGLRNIRDQVAKVLLFIIELYRRKKDERCLEKALTPKYWLELIMPKKWEKYWNFDKVPQSRRNESTEETPVEYRNKRIKYLGNMILLLPEVKTTRKRGSLSFAEKMTSIKKWGTFFFTTKDDIVIPYENGDTIWDEAKIEARTEKLEKEIKEIWGE